MTIKKSLNPVIENIKKQYKNHRKMGRTREDAIMLIRNEYVQELNDEDDRLAVLIGLSLALCKKKELFESIAIETLDEVKRIYYDSTRRMDDNVDYAEIIHLLENKEMYGTEASYRKTSIYVPDWKVGDTFSHVLTYPLSKALGITGWIILLYKVGEYVDEFNVHHQLVLVSLCSPDKVPGCDKDFEKLEFLPMMYMGDKVEYLAQITVKSKKEEASCEITKVGCFPDVLLPYSYVKENPLTAMPLFIKKKGGEKWPGYEDQICRIYKKWSRMKK